MRTMPKHPARRAMRVLVLLAAVLALQAAAPVIAPRVMPSAGSLSRPVRRTYSAASVRITPTTIAC